MVRSGSDEHIKSGAIMSGDYKLIYGDPSNNNLDDWYLTDGTKVKSNTTGDERYLLYDVRSDPTETEDLSSLKKYRDVRRDLIDKLKAALKEIYVFPRKGEKCDLDDVIDEDGHYIFGCCQE